MSVGLAGPSFHGAMCSLLQVGDDRASASQSCTSASGRDRDTGHPQPPSQILPRPEPASALWRWEAEPSHSICPIQRRGCQCRWALSSEWTASASCGPEMPGHWGSSYPAIQLPMLLPPHSPLRQAQLVRRPPCPSSRLSRYSLRNTQAVLPSSLAVPSQCLSVSPPNLPGI